MLSIKNIYVSANKLDILQNVNLSIPKGETHFLMGPNGSGKSTLGHIIIGNPAITLDKGDIYFKNKNINKLSVTDRANRGVFLAFQEPIEIPGLSNIQMLKAAYNCKRLANNLEEIDPAVFLRKIYKYAKDMKLDKSFLMRDLNVNCSGGEKKLNEILYMLLLKPSLCILDEIDSGIDIDSLEKIIIQIKKMKNTTFLIITHNPDMINLLMPSKVHIIIKGQMKYTGHALSVFQKLKTSGYKEF